MNKKVYALAALLILIAVVLIVVRLQYGGRKIRPEFERNLWRVTVTMNITGKSKPAKIRLTLPQTTNRQIIYNEIFHNAEMKFTVRERAVSGNRIGAWRSNLLDGLKSVNYKFSAQVKGQGYPLPQDVIMSQALRDSYPPDFKLWMDPSEHIQSKDVFIDQQIKKIIGREKNVAQITRKIYDFVRGEVKYRSEKGSKDAKETLGKLVADCGGKARLFTALSRSAGIPSRLVGGLVLAHGVKKVTHVWTENYIGGKWIPFDVVNDHFAAIPGNYIELYRGDYALIKHAGIATMDYYFLIERERIPPVDHPLSLYALPINFQNVVKILLLLPIGALIVAFARTVLGIPTYGTFAPVLLALTFREISLWSGLMCLVAVVVAGWLLRVFLDYLKILIIPKLAFLVTSVVIIFLITMVVGFQTGHEKLLYISLFPIIIITWMIERLSVVVIEDGTGSAVTAAIGTAAVAILAYYILANKTLNAYLFEFPESLLIVQGLLLLLGRYTGVRLMEIWRFREFARKPSD